MMGEYPEEGGEYGLRRGRMVYGELGRETAFRDLPEGCRTLILHVYAGMWDL